MEFIQLTYVKVFASSYFICLELGLKAEWLKISMKISFICPQPERFTCIASICKCFFWGGGVRKKNAYTFIHSFTRQGTLSPNTSLEIHVYSGSTCI